MRRIRLFYAGLFCLLLITEILIALFVNDDYIRPYVGDVLVTLLICSFWRMFFPKGIAALPVYVFLFALAVELGQLFDIVGLLGIDDPFLSVLLGATFSWWDVFCYAAGCLLAFGTERMIGGKRQSHR